MRENDTIRMLAALLNSPPSPQGIGDDGAVVRGASTVCVDTMVEGVHFRREWSTMADVAYKLVASNVSDTLAMGALADWAVLALHLPSPPAEHEVRDLAEGLRAAIGDWAPGLRIIGGDTTFGGSEMVLSLTVGGLVHFDGAPWVRSAATPGERVWIDGPVGLAAAGLAALSGELDGEVVTPDTAGCVEQHRRPVPPSWITGPPPKGVSACIDVSDGLFTDLGRLCAASGVAASVRLPLPGGSVLERVCDTVEQLIVFQLAGGDDYVRIASSRDCPGEGWTCIGEFASGDGVRVVDSHGNSLQTDAFMGYEHGTDGP